MLNLGKHLKAWALEYADGPWVWEEIGDRSVYGVRKNKHFSTPEALELLILLRELQSQLPMSKYLTKDDYVHLANRLIR